MSRWWKRAVGHATVHDWMHSDVKREGCSLAAQYSIRRAQVNRDVPELNGARRLWCMQLT